MSSVVEKVVIIGSGPAGWTAAIYAHQDELDQRAAAYFNVASNGGADVPSSPPTAAETSSRNPADVAPLSAAANSLSESAQLKNH